MRCTWGFRMICVKLICIIGYSYEDSMLEIGVYREALVNLSYLVPISALHQTA